MFLHKNSTFYAGLLMQRSLEVSLDCTWLVCPPKQRELGAISRSWFFHCSAPWKIFCWRPWA